MIAEAAFLSTHTVHWQINISMKTTYIFYPRDSGERH